MEDMTMITRRGMAQEGSNHNNNLTSSSSDHQQKIPIWIGSDCKLLSGINKLTTCSEIIQALVHSSDDPAKFVIVEKWRKMERKLDPNVRILKVWKEWGDQKNDVALILRHYHSSTSSSTTTCSTTTTNDGYIDKRGSAKMFHRRKSASSHHTRTIPNRTTASTTINTNTNTGSGNSHVERKTIEEVQMTESMERILSLVLTQGETIQAQLKKLRCQEEQIDRYEEQMHRIRSLKDGENYVVESYLDDERGLTAVGATNCKGLFGVSRSGSSSNKKRDKSPKKSSKAKYKDKHGMSKMKNEGKIVIDGCSIPEQFKITTQNKVQTADPLSSDDIPPLMNSEALLQQNELMERICTVNGELTREEERLVKLGLKIKKYQQQSAEAADDDENEDDGEDDHHLQEEESEHISQLNLELEPLRKITIEQSHEIEQNEQHLTEIETILDEKHDCIVHLTYEIQLLDVESDLLQQRLLQITKPLQQRALQQQNIQPLLQPPPYEQAIVASILANNYLVPYNTHCPSEDGESDSIPDNSVVSSNNGSASEREASRANEHPNANVTASVQDTNINCNSNADGYCQYQTHNNNSPNNNNNASSPSSTTELSLHLKSTDHQDNDSNSDTGISSLHSSGDENTLFTLDTLV